ncbi:hypothetical protein [Limnofasciculus baicalensis]|uniref:Uncharacterized protein n=1 Tax=Limnofasciculus baicalensis BBK-W-15 TaxID=2699891 RepID=A0AAE3GSR3_9CYAN|nr:hypothetical protein [Limnofasciculus baicalensis]MCP2730001.1 hypothetical protein [Limnofasciculus baicalensis BBK-W-15]
MNSVNIVRQTRQKTLLSLGSLFLVFLSTGCVNPFTPNLQLQSCKDAQTKVSQVQKQYNEVVAQLASPPKDEANSSSTTIIQKLQESQEEALEVCERVD